MASNLNRFMIHATEVCNVVCSAIRFYRSIEEVIGYFIIIHARTCDDIPMVRLSPVA